MENKHRLKWPCALFVSSHTHSSNACLLPQEKLLLVLSHPERALRHTCGSIVSVVVGAAGVSCWPQLIGAIAACMQSGNEMAADGGVSTLFKIIEDVPSQLEVGRRSFG